MKNDTEDKHLFSKELRDALSSFGKMDVKDALRSPEFLKALCDHAGMSEEEFNPNNV